MAVENCGRMAMISMAFGFGQWLIVILLLLPQISIPTGDRVKFLLFLLATLNIISESIIRASKLHVAILHMVK